MIHPLTPGLQSAARHTIILKKATSGGVV